MLESELRRKYGQALIPFGFFNGLIECLEILSQNNQPNVVSKLNNSGDFCINCQNSLVISTDDRKTCFLKQIFPIQYVPSVPVMTQIQEVSVDLAAPFLPCFKITFINII